MDRLIKSVPIIYPLLIFSGYIDYVSYYRQFHISIVSYLTTTELLLSFLTITGPLLFLLLLVSIGFIIKLSAVSAGEIGQTIAGANTESHAAIVGFIRVYPQILKGIKNIKGTFSSIFFLIFDIAHFLISLAGLIFFVIYFFIISPFLVESNPMGGPVLDFGFILSFFWFLLLLNMVIAATDRLKKPISTQIFSAFAIVSFLSLLAIYNKQESSRILQGTPKFQVSLDLNEKVISTDSSFLYVGKTEKFFFFFDKKNNRNVIFPTEHVTKIQINSAEEALIKKIH